MNLQREYPERMEAPNSSHKAFTEFMDYLVKTSANEPLDTKEEREEKRKCARAIMEYEADPAKR